MSDTLPPRKPIQRERGNALSRDDLDLMIRVAKQREALVEEMEQALDNNELGKVLQIAWRICGRNPDGSKSDWSNPPKHG